MKYGKDEINEENIYAIANSARKYYKIAEKNDKEKAKEKFER